ncbi:helix-turn-helix transcriptional regulator [Streptomyces olivoreticuli]
MDSKIALRDFLLFCRSRLRPEDVGLPVHGSRRVPGLRRDEVAALASVSVDQYIRLERGHVSLISDAVLDAVADALALTPGERSYLRALARRGDAGRERSQAAEQGVRDSVQRILDSLHGTPAYLVGRNGAILAWNRLATLVFFDFARIPPRDRSLGRLVFTHPGARSLFLNWDGLTREIVAYLRTENARRPNDAELSAYLRQLMSDSPDFRRLWTTQFAFAGTQTPSRLACPALGTTLHLSWELLHLTDSPEEKIVAYTAAEGSPSFEALRRLEGCALA